jgi:hypothetical protein
MELQGFEGNTSSGKMKIRQMKEAMWTKKIRRTCRRVALDSYALDRSLVTPQTLASFIHVWETQCK